MDSKVDTDLSNEIEIIKLEDLNNQKDLPKELVDFINKQSFNGPQIEYEQEEEEHDVKFENNEYKNDAKDTSNTSSSSSIISQNDNLESGQLINKEQNLQTDETYDRFDIENLNENKFKQQGSNSTIKRTHLINLIFELYDLNFNNNNNIQIINKTNESIKTPNILVESYMEKLPPGKNLKNSILLAWRRRYFKLNSFGVLYIYDIDDKTDLPKEQSDEIYNLMGGKVDYEQNKIISLDDGRGNYLVFRCCLDCDNTSELFSKWKQEIDNQIVDRSDSLWVKPNQPLSLDITKLSPNLNKKNILIIDIGTCSIRAGLFDNEPKLPKLFVPTVCSKDVNQNKLKVGFDAFDFLLGSSAPSTIDLRKSMSSWSLSTNYNNQLIFPLKTKTAIDKLNVEFDSYEAIISYVVDSLNINCQETEVVLITSHKLTDKLNIQYLNLLLKQEKFRFKSAMIINQTLMALYSYNTNVGVIANLGEKIDIVPICNGIPFQSGVTNLAYGGSCMSEFLNYHISRGHVSYVNDMEQFFVRYVKEKSCYAALNYQNEINKYPNDSKKYSLELTGRANEFKKVEFPESARFRAVEGLFNPEIWGLDGQGLHKLIHKAIQSSSMDLRREMARNIYLCGGMSQIPGLKERLEKELRQLLPPTLKVKVNCSEYSYHSAYLGAFRFVQQPEYEKLLISREEWLNENVNCLRKWRSI